MREGGRERIPNLDGPGRFRGERKLEKQVPTYFTTSQWQARVYVVNELTTFTI
jgi:hypothetical protein